MLASLMSAQILNALPDQDSFYDLVDSLEEQGIYKIINHYMSQKGSNQELQEQFQIYEAAIYSEDFGKNMDNSSSYTDSIR